MTRPSPGATFGPDDPFPRRPWQGEARLLVARAFALRGAWQEAVEEYARLATEPFPAGPGAAALALIERARLLRDAAPVRDARGALDALEAAATIEPRSATVAYERGLLCAAAGKHDRALQEFATAIALDASWPPPHAGRAEALAQLGRKDESAEESRAAARLSPREPPSLARTYLRLADLFRPKGFLSDPDPSALRYVNRALAECPTFALAHFQRGICKMNSRQAPACATDLLRAVQLNPAFATRLYRTLRKAQKDPGKAQLLGPIRQQLEREDASDPAVRFGKAFFDGLAGKYAESLAQAEALATAHPEFLAAALWQGWMQYRSGAIEAADATFEACHEVRNDIGVLEYFRACTAAKLGRTEAARKRLQRARQCGFDDSELLAEEEVLRGVLR